MRPVVRAAAPCALLFAVVASAPACADGPKADDCAARMKTEWNADERAAAMADCAFYNDSLQRKAAAWSAAAAEQGVNGTHVGRAAIRQTFDRVYAQPQFQLVWYPDAAHQFSPGFVVTSGPWSSRGPDEKGAIADSKGRYVTVWRKQADGGWKFAWDGGEEFK